MTLVFTSVDRGGEGSPIEKTSLRPFLVVSAPSAEVSNVHEAKNVLLLVQNEEHVHKHMDYFPPVSSGGTRLV